MCVCFSVRETDRAAAASQCEEDLNRKWKILKSFQIVKTMFVDLYMSDAQLWASGTHTHRHTQERERGLNQGCRNYATEERH